MSSRFDEDLLVCKKREHLSPDSLFFFTVVCRDEFPHMVAMLMIPLYPRLKIWLVGFDHWFPPWPSHPHFLLLYIKRSYFIKFMETPYFSWKDPSERDDITAWFIRLKLLHFVRLISSYLVQNVSSVSMVMFKIFSLLICDVNVKAHVNSLSRIWPQPGFLLLSCTLSAWK